MDFEIKNPEWQRNFFIVLICISVSGAAAITALRFVLTEAHSVLAFMLIPVFNIAIGAFGIYAWNKETFSFKSGEFKYVKVIKKTESIKASEIQCVKITKGSLIKVQMVDKNGKAALSFLDDGTAFKDNLFINVLSALQIPIEYF